MEPGRKESSEAKGMGRWDGKSPLEKRIFCDLDDTGPPG
jgi:hypothetical protein